MKIKIPCSITIHLFLRNKNSSRNENFIIYNKRNFGHISHDDVQMIACIKTAQTRAT